MNNKVVIITAVIASILVVGMISPIGPVYAHVNVCSSSNDHDKDGIPFSALWVAVCDLQSQIDGLQNQINNFHGGTQSNIVSTEVQLSPGICSLSPSGIPYGWCPDKTTSQYLIHDSAIGNSSVIETTTYNPVNPMSVVSCPVQTSKLVDGPDSGFLIQCNSAPDTGTVLNYIIFNPSTPNTCTAPQVLQNGICVTPPVTCTAPQVLQNGICVTPTQDDDKDKKQGSNSQFTNYKNENRH